LIPIIAQIPRFLSNCREQAISLIEGFKCYGDFATLEPTGENGCMNEQVAYALIDAELRRLQEPSYSDPSALIGKAETKERVDDNVIWAA
jgi:hypothetical protein